MSAIDAVDGSSTGTRVPRIWAPFEAPTVRKSYLCGRFRQSVSISPSRSFKRMALMRPARWSWAVEAPVRLGILPEAAAMPGGDRGVRLIPPLVPRAAGVRAYGAIDAAGLCEALRQAAEERHHGRRGDADREGGRGSGHVPRRP